jgi:hypothetical protein
MNVAAARARADMIGDPGFAAQQTRRYGVLADKRRAAGNRWINLPSELLSMTSREQVTSDLSHYDLRWPEHQPRRRVSKQDRLLREIGDFSAGRCYSVNGNARSTTARKQEPTPQRPPQHQPPPRTRLLWGV